MIISLLELKFPCASFYNSASQFENVELQIDVNHELQAYAEDKNKLTTKTVINVYPKNPASVDGEFKVRVEAQALFQIPDVDVNSDKIRSETFHFIYPYVRSAVTSLLATVEFPIFHLPYMDIK
ncbi:hypothetical protein [Hominenteromicrobium sp.]|uniref:hypothetical protein n=1 Tax=Hominenteromicrobium sp. TaxID=3073581 RepID=UPI003AB14675